MKHIAIICTLFILSSSPAHADITGRITRDNRARPNVFQINRNNPAGAASKGLTNRGLRRNMFGNGIALSGGSAYAPTAGTKVEHHPLSKDQIAAEERQMQYILQGMDEQGGFEE